MPDAAEVPQAATIEAAFDQRIRAKVAANPEIPEPQRVDFISILLELFAGLLASCVKPSPESLARTLKNPSVLARIGIVRQARRLAVESKKFANSRDAADKTVTMLHEVANESAQEELANMIRYGRTQVVPDEFSTI